jgi:hypothetical protein
MKAYLSMASLMCVEQRDYKQSFEYVKTVYLVRLRLFPADSKEIREVESTVFEYALLLLLAYTRSGEHSSVVKKIAVWSVDTAQKGLLACGKKPPSQRVAPVVSREDAVDGLERSVRGESRTKELQVQYKPRHAYAAVHHSLVASGAREDAVFALAAYLPPASSRNPVISP